MSFIVKHSSYLVVFLIGIGLGYLVRGESEYIDPERDRLIQENNDLIKERQEIMDNLLMINDGYQKELTDQDREHNQELEKLKQYYDEKSTRIRKLPADSLLLLFAEHTDN